MSTLHVSTLSMGSRSASVLVTSTMFSSGSGSVSLTV